MAGNFLDSINRYVIIAGATRSGTTSLFHYLGAHPDVCASSIKETRFFLDPEYPMHARHRLEDGFHYYEAYFAGCQTRIRLESSPQYLYSPGSPMRIRRSLGRVKIIFLLRDPIEWLISSFRYAKEVGRLPIELGFCDWVESQFTAMAKGILPTEHHMRALLNGRFIVHLGRYSSVFNPQDIMLYPFQALETDPRRILGDICSRLGIDESFFDGYHYEIHNPSAAIRSAGAHRIYVQAHQRISVSLKRYPRLWRAARSAFRAFRPLYIALNTTRAEDFDLGNGLREKLEHYFREEIEFVGELLARIGTRPLFPVGK